MQREHPKSAPLPACPYLPWAAESRRWSPSAQTGCVRAAAGAFPSRPASPGGFPHTSPASRGTPCQQSTKALATPFHACSLQKILLCATALQLSSQSPVWSRMPPEHLVKQHSNVSNCQSSKSSCGGQTPRKAWPCSQCPFLSDSQETHSGNMLCDAGGQRRGHEERCKA